MNARSSGEMAAPFFAKSRSGRERVAASIYENYLLGRRSLFLIGLPGVGKTEFLNNLPAMVSKRQDSPLLFVHIDIVDFFMRGEPRFPTYFLKKLQEAAHRMSLRIPPEIGEGESDLKAILSRIPEKTETDKTLLRAVVLDHVDGVGPELLQGCDRKTMTEFQIAIRELKFFCPQLGITLLCSGNRHYHIARRDLQRDIDSFASGMDRDEFERKYKEYLKILQTSIYRMDIFYLTGLDLREIDQLCLRYFPDLPKGPDKSEGRREPPITRLAQRIKESVGNHPEMIAMLLKELSIFRESVEGTPDPEVLLDSVVLQMRPFFWNIFQRIWKNEVLETDVEFLRALAGKDRIDEEKLKSICSEFSESTDMPPSFFRAKVDTWESHGLFSPVFPEGANARSGRAREFFSSMFREFIQLREMEPTAPPEASPAPTILTVRADKDGWRLSFQKNKTQITGRLATFFALLWKKRGDTFNREDLANRMARGRGSKSDDEAANRDMSTKLNSLYQLKRRLAERLEPIPVIQLVSVSGEGYRLEIEPGVEIVESEETG